MHITLICQIKVIIIKNVEVTWFLVNINFYFLTNTLLRHILNNVAIPTRKPDPQKLQTLIAKNPKAGILRNKIQSSVKFDIFSHHSAINNFAYANANMNDGIVKKDYMNFVNSWCKGFFSAESREHALRFTGGKIKMNQHFIYNNVSILHIPSTLSVHNR